jgi:hypothetical protein
MGYSNYKLHLSFQKRKFALDLSICAPLYNLFLNTDFNSVLLLSFITNCYQAIYYKLHPP